VLKVALPRPSIDAVSRDDERAPSRRGFDDEADDAGFRPMSRAEAEAFRQGHPVLSPWRVVAAQVAIGVVAGALAWLVAGRASAVSAWYGAAVVAVPGALMARGATSGLSTISPTLSAVSMLGWAFVKIAVSVAMLALASRIVVGLVWPALLTSMVLCLQSYWFALLWRGRHPRHTQEIKLD